MAVGTIVRFSEGMNADLYDAVIEKSGYADKPPAGLIFHAAGEFEGRFQVLDIWKTPAQRERFEENLFWRSRVAVLDEEPVITLPDSETIRVAIHNIIIS